MTISRDSIKGVARGLLSDLPAAADEARADHVFNGRYLSRAFNHTEIGTNVNLAESPIAKVKYAGRVLNTCIMPSANVAVNTSNYVYLTLSTGSTGAASTVIATLNTGVTALTKNIATPLTLNVSGVGYAAGDVLTMTATKYNTGATADTSMTAATSQCAWDVDLEEGY